MGWCETLRAAAARGRWVGDASATHQRRVDKRLRGYWGLGAAAASMFHGKQWGLGSVIWG